MGAYLSSVTYIDHYLTRLRIDFAFIELLNITLFLRVDFLEIRVICKF